MISDFLHLTLADHLLQATCAVCHQGVDSVDLYRVHTPGTKNPPWHCKPHAPPHLLKIIRSRRPKALVEILTRKNRNKKTKSP